MRNTFRRAGRYKNRALCSSWPFGILDLYIATMRPWASITAAALSLLVLVLTISRHAIDAGPVGAYDEPHSVEKRATAQEVLGDLTAATADIKNRKCINSSSPVS